MPSRCPRAPRAFAGRCVGIVLLCVLCGCSPIIDGRTGLTRDANGQLIALAQACHGKFDRAELFQEDDPNSTSNPTPLARWERKAATSEELAWRLDEREPKDWTTTQPLTTSTLERGHTYVLDAWGETQKWSANELRFTLADLDVLSADKVLIAHTEPKTGETAPQMIPRRDFDSSSCDN